MSDLFCVVYIPNILCDCAVSADTCLCNEMSFSDNFFVLCVGRSRLEQSQCCSQLIGAGG